MFIAELNVKAFIKYLTIFSNENGLDSKIRILSKYNRNNINIVCSLLMF